MATLAKDTPRAFFQGDHVDQPIIADDIIYQGAAVGDNASGYARPLVAGDPFFGFCTMQCDNTGGAAGAKLVRIKAAGAAQLAVTSVAITDVGKDVFASDDNVFILTQSTNTRIGFVKQFVSTGVAIVEFESTETRQTKLTDSTSATATTTISDVTGSFSQSVLNVNFATLAKAVNALIARGQ